MLPLQGTLPNRKDSPPIGQQARLIPEITVSISLNLSQPKIGSRCWDLEQVAAVAVPKTSMHEDRHPMFRKH
jgi:hypothetical protein